MAKVRLGGETVAEGGRVKWGLLASIIIGTPLYAYFEGIISLVVGVREFLVHDVLGGIRGWLVTLIDLEFTVANAAAKLAWWEFYRAIRPTGVFAWFLSMVAVFAVLLLFLLLVRVGVSRLV